jgi:predicted metal-dependent phosphoesterase TrpH
VLIDLHCHTTPRSKCSALLLEEMVGLARGRGLDGICLTEHDSLWPEEELAAVRRSTGFPVLGAVELTTDLGHVLAYGLPQGSETFGSAAAAFEAGRESGALLFLAHPARDGLLKVDRQVVDLFESVEAINGSDSRLQNLAATGLARGFRLPGIGGSDAHSAREVGRAATRFEAAISDQASLLAALRSGRYEAVHID